MKDIIACTLLYIVMVPLMEDIVIAKAKCPCSSLIFTSKTTEKIKDLLSKNFTECKDGIKYEIDDNGNVLAHKIPCDGSLFQKLIDIQWGIRCFEETHCKDLGLASIKVVSILTALHMGHASLGALFILLSLFGYGSVNNDPPTLYLKSKFSAFFGAIFGVLGYNNGEFEELFGRPRRKRGANGRYKAIGRK